MYPKAIIVYEISEETETSETAGTDPVSSNESSSTDSSYLESINFEDHLTLLEQQMAGCICFLGVLLGAYLIKALFERFKT